MAKSSRGCYWHLCLANWLAMGGAIASSGDCALAQITPDGTLGASGSVVTPGFGGVDVISGGATRGANLFHSFEQFSVPIGGTAFFNNAADIQNIISRVTGRSISNINGLLQANGTANLFLLNPNGIIFGPLARLDIGGSFLGSTASSLNFADGTQFSATNPQAPPLLTISVPIGLQFGGNAGRIGVQGDGQGTRTTTELIDTTVGLRVEPNHTLAMVGGNVALDGGTLKSAGGRIELGSVAGPGLVNLTPTNTGWALGYSGVPTFGDIQLSGQATVDASGSSGGDIQVQGRRVTLTNGSQIESSTLGSEPGGTLNVTANESVEAIGTTADGQVASGLFAGVHPGATGAGGNLTVETGRLILRDGAGVSTITQGTGAGGTLIVMASDAIELIGTSADGQFSSGLFTSTTDAGDAGDLKIDTEQLIVRDGAKVNVSSTGAGDAANLEVAARSIRLETRASLNADTTAGQGNISLRSQGLVLGSSSNITTNATGTATGGNITIDIDILVALEDSEISANAIGNFGGQVIIDAQSIFGTTEFGEIYILLFGVEFSGIGPVNKPDTGPSQGLASLITTSCAAAAGENEFIITGRGGLPPNSRNPLNSHTVWVDWVTLYPGVENSSRLPVSTNPTAAESAPIVEARGWEINNKGELVLTANAPTTTPHSPWMTPANCHAPEASS